jgi:hypothetical protein
LYFVQRKLSVSLCVSLRPSQVKKDLIDAIAGLPARGAVKQNFRVSNATQSLIR